MSNQSPGLGHAALAPAPAPGYLLSTLRGERSMSYSLEYNSSVCRFTLRQSFQFRHTSGQHPFGQVESLPRPGKTGSESNSEQ